MGQDLRNIPGPRNNCANRLAHLQCDNRAPGHHHRAGGQRDPFSTLSATIPDTHGRLLLLQPRQNRPTSTRPDADGTDHDVPGWSQVLPQLRHTTALLDHFLHQLRVQAQLNSALLELVRRILEATICH